MNAIIGEQSSQNITFCDFNVSKIEQDVNISESISNITGKNGKAIWGTRVFVPGTNSQLHIWRRASTKDSDVSLYFVATTKYN